MCCEKKTVSTRNHILVKANKTLLTISAIYGVHTSISWCCAGNSISEKIKESENEMWWCQMIEGCKT
jgi:hypothetical protein